MSITLELTPELEARLRASAARQGQAVEEYLLSLAEREADPATGEEALDREESLVSVSPRWEEIIRWLETGYRPTAGERSRAFREFCHGLDIGASLTDEDLRRENLYEDRY